MSIVIVDSLYGAIQLPNYLGEVYFTPEVQRLRDVRLLNSPASQMPSLADCRRLNHVVGASHLAVNGLLAGHKNVVPQDMRPESIPVALMIHDVGTPGFAHLLEAEFKARYNWDHEEALKSILYGTYRPENIHHQIYFGKQLKLLSVLHKLGLDPEVIYSLVEGKGPVGKLIAGDLDLDNIDNVFRMASLLGLAHEGDTALRLAASLRPGDSLSVDQADVEAVHRWRDLRHLCYLILVFEQSNLAAQAMLRKAFSRAIEQNLLGPEYWYLTDYEVLTKLRCDEQAKPIVDALMAGRLANCHGVYWYAVPDNPIRLDQREEQSCLENELSTILGCETWLYYLHERRTFDRKIKLEVRSGSTSSTCDFFATSDSIVVGVFSPRKSRRGPTLVSKMISAALAEYGLTPDLRMEIPKLESLYGFDNQGKLPI